MKTVILKYFKILQLLLCYCFMHQATSNKAWIGFFNTNISSIFFFIHKLKSMKTAWEHVEIKSTYMARVLLCSCTKWSLGCSGWLLNSSQKNTIPSLQIWFESLLHSKPVGMNFYPFYHLPGENCKSDHLEK